VYSATVCQPFSEGGTEAPYSNHWKGKRGPFSLCPAGQVGGKGLSGAPHGGPAHARGKQQRGGGLPGGGDVHAAAAGGDSGLPPCVWPGESNLLASDFPMPEWMGSSGCFRESSYHIVLGRQTRSSLHSRCLYFRGLCCSLLAGNFVTHGLLNLDVYFLSSFCRKRHCCSVAWGKYVFLNCSPPGKLGNDSEARAWPQVWFGCAGSRRVCSAVQSKENVSPDG